MWSAASSGTRSSGSTRKPSSSTSTFRPPSNLERWPDAEASGGGIDGLATASSAADTFLGVAGGERTRAPVASSIEFMMSGRDNGQKERTRRTPTAPRGAFERGVRQRTSTPGYSEDSRIKETLVFDPVRGLRRVRCSYSGGPCPRPCPGRAFDLAFHDLRIE